LLVCKVNAVAAGLVIVDTVSVPDTTKLPDKVPPVVGKAFNTLETKKLSVTTASPKVQALANTTVVPVVAVKSVDTRRTPFLYTSM